jgi:hypothetical protein
MHTAILNGMRPCASKTTQSGVIISDGGALALGLRGCVVTNVGTSDPARHAGWWGVHTAKGSVCRRAVRHSFALNAWARRMYCWCYPLYRGQ